MTLTSPALAGRFFTTNATWEAHLFLVTQLRLQKVNLAASELYLVDAMQEGIVVTPKIVTFDYNSLKNASYSKTCFLYGDLLRRVLSVILLKLFVMESEYYTKCIALR